MLIDSHAHIQVEEFASDLHSVLQRAREAGVSKIIVVGGAGLLSTNEDAIRMAESNPGIFATVGVHPHDAKGVENKDLDQLLVLSENPRVVAVGEAGLDFYYDHSPRQVQVELFRRFIQMANETGLPLVVHVRDAYPEAAELLRQEGKGKLRGVIHCFTGDLETAHQFLNLGFYVSFSGILTFKNARVLRDVARQLPADRILVETDSPYLAPVPFRGRRNEPAYVRYVAETLADLRGVGVEEIARTVSNNAETLFKIPADVGGL